MKTLHLLRHAKSSWSDSSLADSDRPLNKRGVRNAKSMAGVLAQQPGAFSNVYCSPALRAQQTLQVMVSRLPAAPAWQTASDLYTFDYRDLLAWLCKASDSCSHITLVGHNPALTELCNILGDTPVDNMPTCAYARIELDVAQWQEMGAARGILQDLVRPGDLAKDLEKDPAKDPG